MRRFFCVSELTTQVITRGSANNLENAVELIDTALHLCRVPTITLDCTVNGTDGFTEAVVVNNVVVRRAIA